ncbi:MAG TPA: hypothetical protein VKR22_03095 [Acidimicrobiales bacterium]|nr:hypothetical protein [Acidimicrobiales bacterium]
MTVGDAARPPAPRRSVVRRTRRQIRHLRQPGGVRRAVRLRLSTQRAFVELNHDHRRCLYLAGSRRSGTSWLSEVLCERYRCRFVLEPFRHDRSVRGADWFTYGRYLAPGTSAPEVEAFVGRVLAGRVRSVWSDRENQVRFVRRRLVKDVWQNTLVPWMAGRFPDLPVVYLLRHPLASASSAASMRWDLFFESMLAETALFAGPLRDVAGLVPDMAADPDPVVPHVLRWCIENAVLTRLLDPSRTLLLFFEDLVDDAPRELARIDAYLERVGPGRFRVRGAEPASLGRSSLSDYRQESGAPGGPSGEERLTRWTRELSDPTVARCLEVVDAFGLGRVYGRDPRPLVAATEVLGAGRVPA